MFAKSYHPSKLFTVEKANAALPLVRAITSDLAALSHDVSERQQRMGKVLENREGSESTFYDEELAQIQQDLEKDVKQLQNYIEELRELGVVPKGGPRGVINTVDFPCIMDDRLVYLCWQYDEPEVLHWHEVDAGFAGRQPLIADAISTQSNL